MAKSVTEQGWALEVGCVLHQQGQGNLQGQKKEGPGVGQPSRWFLNSTALQL